MAFCGKCGAKLDEATGLCPNCDADKLNKKTEPPEADEEPKPKQDTASETKKPLSKKEAKKERKADKKAAKKAKKKENCAKLTTGQKVRRFFLKLFFVLILFVILVAGSCGLMVYYGFLDIPIVDELLDEVGVISYSEFVGQDINESYIPNSENIVYQNESNSFGYVNNMILVFFNSSASEEEINEAVNSVNGKIVGRIAGINQYQIQVEPMEREELDAVCEFLMENENVKYAIIDAVITMDSNVIPNDPWKDTFQGLWGVDWDENNPDGYNWWIEAVRVPSAWEYNDVLNSVNVGIVDNGFDTNHEDLNLTVLNSEVNNAENHGTHVAGIIGAEINNGVGISGILSKKNLYCVDCYATSKQKKSNIAVSSLMDGIVTCLDNNCKVVNMSSGTKFTSKDETAESAKESARYATIYLFAMLDSYDDFIIVQSAGNGNKAGIGVDAHKYTGYFASIDDNIVQSVLDEFKEKEVVLNRDITAEDVKNAYIIVGAMDVKKKKDNWQLSEFSNYGNALTICAPGVDVFSTIVSGGNDGSYGNMDGTSMAAPIVSGIVAMVWSVDPTMSSEQVQTYITDTATEVVLNRNKNDSGTYYLVNANEAVKAAISDLDGRKISEQKGQFEDTDILDGAVEFNGHYYYLYDFAGLSSATQNTWENALAYCQGINGYLATITSEEENEFLFNYMKERGYESAYFGLSKSENKDQWEWVTQEQLDYTNWGDDQDGRYARLSSVRTQAGINHIESSSELNEGTLSYAASLIEDGDLRTAWVEGADGQGVGESISLTFDQTYQISGLEIYAGYQKSEDLYYKNSRPETITVGLSDGTSAQYVLQDVNEKQTVSFPTAVETDRLTIRIDSVYAGSEYTDTAISELVPIAYKQDDGIWEPRDYVGAAVENTTAFICEWGEYQSALNAQPQEPARTTSDERDIVLVLDTSGSMSGIPMEETKKAATNFVNTILEEDASIGIVAYEDNAEQLSDFSVDKSHLTGIVADIYDGGGTNIESGLAEAKSMLDSSNAKKKIIVLMSDGEPNRGKEGEELIAYADEIKNDGVLIYTLGFFENMSGGKSSAQYLMEHLAGDGCHYEVASADDLVFFFEDMADQINGEKYIYIRIACPVDVTVTHNGETLCSAEDDLNVRTIFGTLIFEENENVTDANGDDRIKVLRLKEGEDYDVQIVGTGHGIMDYTIGFMDENGDYNDFRRFENIKITRRTIIDTVATVSKESILNIDEDGDGKYDLKLRAEENGFGEEVEESVLVYVVIGGGVLLLLLILVFAVRKNRKKKKAKENE